MVQARVVGLLRVRAVDRLTSLEISLERRHAMVIRLCLDPLLVAVLMRVLLLTTRRKVRRDA